MRIGVIGSGTLGRAIGGLFGRHGHTVIMGARDPRRVDVASMAGAQVSDYRGALEGSEIGFLCVLGEHVAGALSGCGRLEGRILVDCSNPETQDGRGLSLGFDTSGAEVIARLAPGASVLKAFNHVYAEFLQDDELLRRYSPTILFCGDDPAAKRTLETLLRSCALDPLDCGPLRNARYLEPLAMLMVQLVREQGLGPTGVALRMQRGDPQVKG